MSMKSWIKRKDIQIFILVTLLVLAAYALGYIMGHDSSRAPIVIENASP